MFLFCILLVVPSIIPHNRQSMISHEPISMQTNSDLGLIWGVDEGKNITLHVRGHNDTLGEDYFFSRWLNYSVVALSTLPEEPRSIIPLSAANVYDLDTGERFSLDSYFYVNDFGHAFTNPVIPVGNWTFMTEVGEAYTISLQNLEDMVVENSTVWGLNWSYSYDSLNVRTQTQWFKSNGSLAAINLTVENPDLWTYYVEVEIGQWMIHEGVVDLLLPGIVISAVVMIALLVVIYFKRK